MTSHDPLPEDLPFCVEEIDSDRAIVRFAEYVDHRRTAKLDDQLRDAMRQHLKLACDLTATVEVDSDWLTLLADITVEANQAGKRVAMVGLSETLQHSADILGLTSLQLCGSVDEVWQ